MLLQIIFGISFCASIVGYFKAIDKRSPAWAHTMMVVSIILFVALIYTFLKQGNAL